ncbi:50S ribosomal protein L19 [Candidatus Gracilibacteria bacterium]|nr:MAG: 50S ribosomal protein L19 [Candidatus Gracilibacteria bacterium]
MSDTKLISQIQSESHQAIKDQNFETGTEVVVHQVMKEGGKERIQKTRGLIIAARGSTPLDRMITVRSTMDGVGIEKIFPVNSPAIKEIEIIRRFKVRRKNIGFIRGLTGKAARLKEIK